MSSKFKAGDLVRVLDNDYMAGFAINDLRRVKRVDDGGFVYFETPNGGSDGGWMPTRFELVKPEDGVFVIGTISDNGKVDLLGDGQTYPTHKIAEDIARTTVNRTYGFRTVAVLKVVHEFRRKVEIEEVNHEG